MAYYGQKNYSEELGNGKYTIAEAGCFLTAFCNLLVQLGIANIDPPTLDTWFRNNGVFLKDSDGALEDLAWSSVSRYNANIKVTATGGGPVPPSTPAIVKFEYQSISQPLINGHPNIITHFCLVSKVVNNAVYIIDSFDGVEKGPTQYQNQYHAPIEWATYAVASAPAPAPAPTPPRAPSAPIPIPGNTQNTYNVVAVIPGYRTSGMAAGRTGATVSVEPGSYYVYNQFNGMVNVTKKPGTPGSWINPADNVEPPKPSTDPGTFTVSKAIPGYMTSNEAANHIDATVTVAPDTYFVYNTAHGMVNVTKVVNKPGSWINPADLEAPAPVAAPAAPAPASPPPVETATVTAQPTDSWQQSFKPNPETYVAMQQITVKDLSGQKAPLLLPQYDIVPSAGTFTGPDNVLYSRSPTSVKNGWWYAIPMSVLELESDIFNVNTDITTREATHSLSLRDKLVIGVAKVAGWLERFSKKKQPAAGKGGKQ